MRTGLGIGLLVVSAFMALGFATSDASLDSVATVIALLVAVGIPAGVGGWILYRRLAGDPNADLRRDRLRRETIQSEIVRLAGEKGGKLTIVEVVSALGLPAPEAKTELDALVLNETADIHLTESGIIVYDFHDVRKLEEKPKSRGMLEDWNGG